MIPPAIIAISAEQGNYKVEPESGRCLTIVLAALSSMPSETLKSKQKVFGGVSPLRTWAKRERASTVGVKPTLSKTRPDDGLSARWLAMTRLWPSVRAMLSMAPIASAA